MYRYRSPRGSYSLEFKIEIFIVAFFYIAFSRLSRLETGSDIAAPIPRSELRAVTSISPRLGRAGSVQHRTLFPTREGASAVHI